MRPYMQRVEIGAYYTDGEGLWEVVGTNALGTVTLRGDRSKTARTLGIDAFRRKMWLVKAASSLRTHEKPASTESDSQEGTRP